MAMSASQGYRSRYRSQASGRASGATPTETQLQTHDEPSKNGYDTRPTKPASPAHPLRMLLTMEAPELLSMFRARRESLRGMPDAESAQRVERLDVAIALLVERIAAHSAAAVTVHSADSSAASAVSTDASKPLQDK